MKYLVRAINIYNNLFLVCRKRIQRFQLQIFPTASFCRAYPRNNRGLAVKIGPRTERERNLGSINAGGEFSFLERKLGTTLLAISQTLRGNRLDVPSDSKYVESINGGIICYKRVVGNYSEYPLITTNANNTECGAVTVDTRGVGR